MVWNQGVIQVQIFYNSLMLITAARAYCCHTRGAAGPKKSTQRKKSRDCQAKRIKWTVCTLVSLINPL